MITVKLLLHKDTLAWKPGDPSPVFKMTLVRMVRYWDAPLTGQEIIAIRDHYGAAAIVFEGWDFDNANNLYSPFTLYYPDHSYEKGLIQIIL